MHISDGFLGPWVVGLFWLGSGIVIGIAVRHTRGKLGGERTLLLGAVAVGVFAAQMLNWPIPGGTSARFIGGAFVGIPLGPYLGVPAMSAVVTIQALVFGDGGIIAFGTNLFAMVVVDVFVGHTLFRALRRVHEAGATFVAGWGAITVSALIVDVGIGLSSAFAYELSVTVLIMVVGHTFLGFVEDATTAAVYGYVADARPDLVLGRLDNDSLPPEVGL